MVSIQLSLYEIKTSFERCNMNGVVDEKTFWSKLLKDIDPVIKIAEYDI